MVLASLSAIIVILFDAGYAMANNGLNLIGFGAESVAMGGADLAVARDSSALNTNPAGLTQIVSRQVDIHTAVAFPLDVRHQDILGNDTEVSNRHIVFGNIGYVQHLSGRPLALGIGLFAQGGAGNNYRNLTTVFGTQDDLSSIFRIAKLTTGLAWQARPGLSFGGSLSFFYADLNQKIFPGTSFYNAGPPEQAFFGSELKGMKTLNPGYKLGMMYKPSSRITLGMAYTSRVNLPLDGGILISDFSAVGLGKVTYRDVRAEGLNLPQELGLGIAFKPVRRLLAAVELNWIDWSEAVKRSTLTAAGPDNPGAPPVLALTSRMDWRDQMVIAIGIAYTNDNEIVFRAGYNYGRNPIPDEALNPLLAAISQQTFTLGIGYPFAAKWQIDGGVEYSAAEKIRYTNPELPFGQNAVEINEVLAIHTMLTHRF